MAPAIMGKADRPDLGEELTASFCRTDPAIAKDFARVTFTSDNRADLPKVRARRSVACMASLIDNVLDFPRGRLGGGIALDMKSDVLLEPVLQ